MRSPVRSLVLLVLGLAACAPEPDDFEPNERRLVLVALDGADSLFTLKLLGDAGMVPRLQALQSSGIQVPFLPVLNFDNRVISPEPACSWITIGTGFYAQDHGILQDSFLLSHAYDEVPLTSLHRRRPMLWDVLSAYGVRVAVVGWWLTWPAEWVNGTLVSDRFFASRFDCGPYASAGHPHATPVAGRYRENAPHLTWPDEAADSLATQLEPLAKSPSLGLLQELESLEKTSSDPVLRDHLGQLRSALLHDFLVKETALRLLREDPGIRFTACHFEALDVASHYFWKFAAPGPWENSEERVVRAELPPDHVRFKGVIAGTARLLDGFIGELLDASGEDTTALVVSEHGFRDNALRRFRQRDFCLNPLLERLGLLARGSDGEIDYSRTTCFDRRGAAWNNARLLEMNLQGQRPQGQVESSGPGARGQAWDRVQEQLLSVKVDQFWDGTGEGMHMVGQRTNDLFFKIRPWPTGEMSFAVWHGHPAHTNVQLGGGEMVPLEELFPSIDHSGRHRPADPERGGGFLLVSPVGSSRGMAEPGRAPPLGQDLVLPSQVAPTVLALFGLPRPTDTELGGTTGSEVPDGAARPMVEMPAPPLLWLLDWPELRHQALRRVGGFREFLGRHDPRTPLGARYEELQRLLVGLGYLARLEQTP